MPGDIFDCHNWGRRSYWYLVARETSDAVKSPTMQPTTKNYVTQNINTADVEKLCHRVRDRAWLLKVFTCASLEAAVKCCYQPEDYYIISERTTKSTGCLFFLLQIFFSVHA